MNTFSNIPIRELIDGAPDYLAARVGVRVRHPHPIVDRMRDHDMTLKDISAAIGHALANRTGRACDTDIKAMGAALGTSDFGSLMAGFMRTIVHKVYDVSAESHRALCAAVPVKDFNPVEFEAVDVANDTAPMVEHGEWRHHAVSIRGGHNAQLGTWGKRYVFSRPLVINDDVELIGRVAAAATAGVVADESARLFSLLKSNPVLGDGGAMFHQDYGNLITGAGGFTDDSLGDAMGALRSQLTASGNKANNQAALLVVPAVLELPALKLAAALAPSGLALRVIASPEIPAGEWYVQADPEVAPVLGAMYLDGNPEQRTVNVAHTKLPAKYDGVGVSIWADSGFVALDRVGIVKVVA